MLEGRGQPYVLAVRSNHTLRFLADWPLVQTDPATLADGLEDEDWSSLAAGEGSKGPRLYDWARVRLGWATEDGVERRLLIRRSRLTTVLARLLTTPEIRHLLERLLLRPKTRPAFVWAWSR